MKTKKIFALQVKVKTAVDEYWDWCKENYWDGIGQMTVTMVDSVTCYQGGDPYKLLSDTGVVIEGNIVSVSNAQKQLVLDATSDLDLVTGEKIANCCDITLEEIIQEALI